LDSSLEALQPVDADEGFLQGLKMVSRQLLDVLQQHNCKPVDDLGHPFDPSVHEAIGQQPSNEHAEGTVMISAQTGYRLHDRVIRPAQVIVSTGPQSPSNSDDAAGQ